MEGSWAYEFVQWLSVHSYTLWIIYLLMLPIVWIVGYVMWGVAGDLFNVHGKELTLSEVFAAGVVWPVLVACAVGTLIYVGAVRMFVRWTQMEVW